MRAGHGIDLAAQVLAVGVLRVDRVLADLRRVGREGQPHALQVDGEDVELALHEASPRVVEIGAGLGAFKGKVWRIGLMGYGSRPANVLLFLAALEQLLAEQRYAFTAGASVAAANAVYG